MVEQLQPILGSEKGPFRPKNGGAPQVNRTDGRRNRPAFIQQLNGKDNTCWVFNNPWTYLLANKTML